MLSVLANIPTSWNIDSSFNEELKMRNNALRALPYAPLYLCLLLYCLCSNCLDVTYLFPWTRSSYPILYHTFNITKQLFSIFVASNPQSLLEAYFVLFPLIRFKMMANSLSRAFISYLLVCCFGKKINFIIHDSRQKFIRATAKCENAYVTFAVCSARNSRKPRALRVGVCLVWSLIFLFNNF